MNEMNNEALNLMRGLFTVAAGAFERAEMAESEGLMIFNQETAKRLFPQAAAAAAVAQAEALASIAESLARIADAIESADARAETAAIWSVS